MQIPGEYVDNSLVDPNGIFQQSWRKKNDPGLFWIFSTFSVQGKNNLPKQLQFVCFVMKFSLLFHKANFGKVLFFKDVGVSQL